MNRKSIPFSFVLVCVGALLATEAAIARPTVVDPVNGWRTTLCPHYGNSCRMRWEGAIHDDLTGGAEEVSEEMAAAAEEAVRLFKAAYPTDLRGSTRAAWEAAVLAAEMAEEPPSDLDLWREGISAMTAVVMEHEKMQAEQADM